MTTEQERVRILKMVESGRITAEEGARLLGAIDEAGTREHSEDGEASSRWFRVRVTDMLTGNRKVSLNIPFALVDLGMRIGARLAPDAGGIDLEQLREAIHRGVRGKLIDVEDHEGGERVEIYVE